jgi:2-polyprenyl-3-methyl-5-hydroxy-6-metoxy-1,4-benzoquinol methylase
VPMSPPSIALLLPPSFLRKLPRLIMNAIGVRNKLNGMYWWLEKRIDPRTRSSQYLYAETLRSTLGMNCRWLDVGCGRQVLPDWIPEQGSLINAAELRVGMDYTAESMRGNQQLSCLVVGSIEHAPFAPNSFDVVSANMVVEHLEKPLEALREVHRILRPCGCFVFHTTNFRFYLTFVASLIPQSLKNRIIKVAEGRNEQDVFPTHFHMNSLKEIYETARLSGFRVVECRSVNTSSTSDMMFGPFVIVTLLVRRLLQWKWLRQFRSNFVAVLEKPSRA